MSLPAPEIQVDFAGIETEVNVAAKDDSTFELLINSVRVDVNWDAAEEIYRQLAEYFDPNLHEDVDPKSRWKVGRVADGTGYCILLDGQEVGDQWSGNQAKAICAALNALTNQKPGARNG